jgi:Transposase IS116/IS110/IS902 family
MHRVRELLVRQRTQLINAVRGHLAEFGLVVSRGPWNVPQLLASMQEDRRVRELARQVLELLAAQLDEVGLRLAEVDARIMAWHKAHPVSRRLATIPGVGPLIATAIAATVPDPDAFRGGREFAGVAWPGAAAEIHWRQAEIGPDQQARRQVHPSAADRRSPNRPAALEGSPVQRMDPEPADQATAPRGRRRSGQQDGSHRLGRDGAGAELPAGSPSISGSSPAL